MPNFDPNGHLWWWVIVLAAVASFLLGILFMEQVDKPNRKAQMRTDFVAYQMCMQMACSCRMEPEDFVKYYRIKSELGL